MQHDSHSDSVQKEINHKGLARFGRNEGASPLDKCCGGSERVFGVRNTVVAILEKDGLLQ